MEGWQRLKTKRTYQTTHAHALTHSRTHALERGSKDEEEREIANPLSNYLASDSKKKVKIKTAATL